MGKYFLLINQYPTHLPIRPIADIIKTKIKYSKN